MMTGRETSVLQRLSSYRAEVHLSKDVFGIGQKLNTSHVLLNLFKTCSVDTPVVSLPGRLG